MQISYLNKKEICHLYLINLMILSYKIWNNLIKIKSLTMAFEYPWDYITIFENTDSKLWLFIIERVLKILI